MVNINLLEKEKVRRRRQKSFFRPAAKSNTRFLVYLVMVFAVCLAAYFHWEAKGSLAEASARRAELQEQSAQLAAIQAESEKYEELKNQALDRINAIEALRENQRDPVQLMNALVASVSSGSNIWLTSLSKEGSFISVQGYSTDVPAIADLIETLAGTPPFSSVEINYWEAQENSPVVQFDLSCEIRETPVETEAADQGEGE